MRMDTSGLQRKHQRLLDDLAVTQRRGTNQLRALQKELANTEDRIAAARRFFNGNVREMNQLCQQFPTNLIADNFGFHEENYFELASDAERVVPRV